MTINITIKDPVPQGTELIGIKDDLAYVLELNDLTVGRIDICEDRNAAVKERYKHLLKAYGKHSEYLAGFRDCMSVVAKERSKK